MPLTPGMRFYYKHTTTTITHWYANGDTISSCYMPGDMIPTATLLNYKKCMIYQKYSHNALHYSFATADAAMRTQAQP